MLEYILHTARGCVTPPHDTGVVAVLDGRTVKLTPFKTANIPPPMALHELEVSSNAIDIAINEDATTIAVLHNEGISLFEWKSTSAASPIPELTGKVTFEKLETDFGRFQQVVIGSNNHILVLQRCGEDDIIKSFGFNDDTGRMEEQGPVLTDISSIAAISSFLHDCTTHTFLQGRHGELASIDQDDDNLAHAIAATSSPNYLPWLEIVPHNDRYIAFGLTPHGHLYANSRQLVKNCTSFVVTPAHLIFTTTTHMLKFVHITDVNGRSYRIHPVSSD